MKITTRGKSTICESTTKTSTWQSVRILHLDRNATVTSAVYTQRRPKGNEPPWSVTHFDYQQYPASVRKLHGLPAKAEQIDSLDYT